KAGLQTDDIIAAVDGQRVSVDVDLYALIGGRKPGDKLELQIQRGFQRLTVPVTLEPLPPDGGNGRITSAAEAGEAWAMLEMAFRYGGMSAAGKYLESNDGQCVRWL